MLQVNNSKTLKRHLVVGSIGTTIYLTHDLAQTI